jgi:hypothetical protein
MKAKWEEIESNLAPMYRLQVPGGWLVAIYADKLPGEGEALEGLSIGLVFYPDPAHQWKQ